MSALADYLARRLWFYMLWFMRRRWMKRLQWRTMGHAKREEEPARWEQFKRQNRFSRRIGLPLMRFMMNVFVISILISFSYATAVYLYSIGAFTVPAKR